MRRLRQLRVAAKWRQRDLAAESSLDQGTISRLESGETKNPSAETLAALVRALNFRFRRLRMSLRVRTDELLPTGTDDPMTQEVAHERTGHRPPGRTA
jgi:transcriptional regulator with XRE-family HTH domain